MSPTTHHQQIETLKPLSECDHAKHSITSSVVDRRKSVIDETPVISKHSSLSVLSRMWNSNFKSKKSFWLISAYIYIPIALIAATVKYYGGVNEAMVAVMSQGYYNYGRIHGHGDVFVRIEQGQLKGFKSYSREGKEFYQFLGNFLNDCYLLMWKYL